LLLASGVPIKKLYKSICYVYCKIFEKVNDR